MKPDQPVSINKSLFDYAQVARSRELSRELSDLVRDLDDYEVTIALVYIKRLIKSREGGQ